MPLTPADKHRISQLVETSKNDDTIIVGSDIREMAMFIQKLEQENLLLHQERQAREAICNSQRRHQELCARVYDAAVKAKIIYGIGACGNGGVPTFDAVVDKIEEACRAVASANVDFRALNNQTPSWTPSDRNNG
jgi:hypothetical protein